FDTLFAFSTYDTKDLDKFWSVRQNERGVEEIPYKRSRTSAGHTVYVDAAGNPWKRSASGMMIAVEIEENGQRVRFNAPLTPDGKNFRFEQTRGIEQPMRYAEVGGGRYMDERSVGVVVQPRTGQLLGNLVLNFLHLVVWFVVLWLLLRFQWPHALGLAVCLWLAMALAGRALVVGPAPGRRGQGGRPQAGRRPGRVRSAGPGSASGQQFGGRHGRGRRPVEDQRHGVGGAEHLSRAVGGGGRRPGRPGVYLDLS